MPAPMPSDYTRGNLYVDTVLPFRKQMWSISMAEAQAQAASETEKLKLRAKYIELLEERQIKLEQIKADFRQEWAAAGNDADKAAALARANEQKERLTGVYSAMRTNADAKTEMDKARTYAQSNIESAHIRAGGDSSREQRAIQLQSARDEISNTAKTGQRDMLGASLLSNVENPLLAVRAGEDGSLGGFEQGVRNLRDDVGVKKGPDGKPMPFPATAVAESVSKVADPGFREQAANAVRGQLSEADRRRFDEAYDLFTGKSSSVAGTGGEVPNLGGGRVDLNRVANMPTPDAQGSYLEDAERVKANVDQRYMGAVQGVEDDIARLEAERAKLLTDAMGYQSPDIVNLARQHYAQHFTSPPPRVNVQLPKVQLPQIGRRPELEALGVEPIAQAIQPVAPTVSYLPAAPVQMGGFHMGQPAPVPQVRPPVIAPGTPLYPPLDAPVSPVGNPPYAPGDEWFMPPQPQVSPQILERMKPPPAAPGGPGELRPKDPQASLESKPQAQAVKPAVQTVAKATNPESPANRATKSHPVLLQAETLKSQPNKVDRLLANDPVSKHAASMYAIDRRNNVPLLQTAQKLTKAYPDNPEKQQRALAILNVLYLRDTQAVAPPSKVA